MDVYVFVLQHGFVHMSYRVHMGTNAVLMKLNETVCVYDGNNVTILECVKLNNFA